MDRTSLKTKLKSALTGKTGVGAAVLAVGAIALTAGLHFGKREAPRTETAKAEAAPAKPEAAREAGKPEGTAAAAVEAHESHAEHVAMKSAENHGEESRGEETRSEESRPGWFRAVFGTYAEAWHSVQQKVDDVKSAEVENERLRLENTHLRLSLEGLQFNCGADDAAKKTQSIEYKLDKETGSLVGRDLASIAYRVPTNLVPGQLYTLGISYFKAREDEKAAVIFTFLTGLDDNDTFRTPKNFLLTGIAWYRLDNYATADRYFDRALKAQETPENLQTLAHARLWKALSADRIGKHAQSQFWLTELIDHHPLSVEASWVNSKGPRPKLPEAERGTASED